MAAKGPLWRRVLANFDRSVEQRSATQIYLDGGGDPADARTMSLLAEADRPFPDYRSDSLAERVAAVVSRQTPAFQEPLHAHEITDNDAALIRAMAGAHLGPDATVTLPSGRTITGAEMQRWLGANR